MLVIVCLAAALFFRLWHLTTIPPGFHLDEAMDTHLTRQILQGHLFFYTSEGWGREGLYYYAAAPVLYLARDSMVGMRLTSALLGAAMAGLAGWMATRLFDPDTGALTLAWTALTFWPVFTSRVAVRNISLGVMLTLAVIAFWWAWNAAPSPRRAHLIRFSLAGLLWGLSLYTYQPARASPGILIAFVAYAALFHRPALRARWRGLAVGGLVLILTALPLAYFLLLNPAAEGPERIAMTAPLDQLLAGNPQTIVENALAVLKMFTVQGDSLTTYNLPGRPVFPGLAMLPFYLGALMCLRRWREPAVALVTFWLGAMLIPTLLTTSAPHFFRSIGAIVPAMIIPAVGLSAAARFLSRRWGQWGAWASGLLIVLILGQTAWLTWQDYFNGWARLEKTATNYNARETALARYLRDEVGPGPAVVGARASEAGVPFVVSAVLSQPAPITRWVVPSQALAFPAEQPAARMVLITDIKPNNYLMRNYAFTTSLAADDQPWLQVTQLRPPTEDAPLPEMEMPQGGPWFAPAGAELPDSPGADLTPAHLPVKFQASPQGPGLALVRYGLSAHSLQAGKRLRLVTLWQIVAGGSSGSVAMFAHLVNPHGQIAAQQDQFGYPVHSWQAGDLVIQVHDLTPDPSTPPGRYWLQIGFYERDTPGRWAVTNPTGNTAADRLLLDQVEIQP